MSTLLSHPVRFQPAQRLLADAHALAHGLAPFDVLTPEERGEQLAQLLHVGKDRPAKYPGFRTMSDDDLINIVADPFVMPGESMDAIIEEATAELARRMAAPTDDERDDIEGRVLVMDEEYQEAQRWQE